MANRNATSEGMRAVATELVDGTTVVSLDPLVQSVPTTGTFHHLGHEGKVFIYSNKHGPIADGASLDHLIRIAAGASTRQIHFRFDVIVEAVTGSLDADVYIYKDTTVSDDGTAQTIVSTNDALVKTTGVTIFSGPTVTDVGTFKSQTWSVGTKKGSSNLDQAVPEWIFAPDDDSARNYLFRISNNSGGDINAVVELFWYDSLAA